MHKQAFTIIELVIVISVLVILIGIAIPRMKGMQDAANITKVKHELATLQSAVESYYTFSTPHAYPNSSLTALQPSLINSTPQIISTYLYDPFCSSSVNSCSGTDQEYGYTGPDWAGGAQYYVIWSVGPADTENPFCSLNSNGSVYCMNYGVSKAPASCAPGSTGCPICVTNGTGC
ncbi:MAG: type II secretion system protein [Candidatus Omnitrophica bacterium]|nr:type II secretion system protein [Candidatus Omnitrophota bacterium]